MAIPLINKGRLINFINGITGVQAGGNAVVNLPVNQRYHRLKLQCTAVNYTGGTAMDTTTLTGAGTGLKVTPTIVNGVVTAVAVTAGGSGYTTGDTISIVDATGTGFVGTVTAAAGAVTAVAVTVGGTASPISPTTFFSAIKLLVNGVNVRDISPENILKIAMANGLNPALGELPIYFTSPWRNVNEPDDVDSWDLFGQSTFQLQMTISSTVSNPGVVGIQEFDYQRNLRPDGKGGMIPFLQPVAQHQFSMPIVQGINDITTLPYNFPIGRLWLQGSTPGSITQVEVYQDGNKVFEATLEQILEAYRDYGFQFGQPNYLNQNYGSNSTLQGDYEEPAYFDAAFISDPDQRWWRALKIGQNFNLRVYSSVAQTLTVVQETLPGSYSA